MTSKLFIASALGIALTAGGLAYASEQGGTTRADAVAKAREHFARMDVNKDAKLDAADRGAHHQQMAGAMFDRIDADKNGSISREEWSAGAARMAEAHGGADGPRHMLKMRRPAMHMMQADADGDRAITAQEWEARALRRFDGVDRDRDGILSPAERQEARGLTPHVTRD